MSFCGKMWGGEALPDDFIKWVSERVKYPNWQTALIYTQEYFGPNAMPVLELQDGKILNRSRFQMSSDVFWGFGDQTQSVSARFDYPIVPGRIQFSAWGVLFENFQITNAVRYKRASIYKDGRTYIGDIYLSAKINVLKEHGKCPDILLETILKTASSRKPKHVRFFDTPGYFFNAISGKTFKYDTRIIDSVRCVALIGFMAYQMSNRDCQNDVVCLSLKAKMNHRNYYWENFCGTYIGWLNRGDRPVVLRTKLGFRHKRWDFFSQYQYALNDYPFYRLNFGAGVEL